MGRTTHVAKLAVGLLLTVLTMWNLHIGFYQMGGGEMHKLVLTMVFSGSCSETAIRADINAAGISDCLQPLGTWEPIDVILLSIGVILSWRALRALFSSNRRRSRTERQGKNLQRLGMLVAFVGVADFFGMLTDDGRPMDAGELLGFPFPNGVSLILLTTALLLSLIGGSMQRRGRRSSSGSTSSGTRRFLGPAERHLPGDFSVGQLRKALMLDAFEDPFQVSTGDDWGDSVGRTCHYCNGAGCDQCDNTGYL
ncbi:MAG: hypothetical protein CMB65_01245 [Euryarchaeota archaeon]|nr:hypothetical protein [Euryarchaeota archaeon]